MAPLNGKAPTRVLIEVPVLHMLYCQPCKLLRATATVIPHTEWGRDHDDTISPAAVGRVHRPAKVSNFEFSAHAQQQVLWLDVTVDDVLGVAVLQGACQ